MIASLRPYPAYRPSGAEWLGSLPEHWEAVHLRYLVRCLDGQRVPLNAEERGEMQGEYPYWGASRVIDHVNRWIFDEPLVLLGEDGAPFTEPGRDVASAVSGRIWVNNHTHVLRCGGSMTPKFLAHALNSVDYTGFIDGSTRDKLTQQDMGAIPIQRPPLPEQAAIVRFLDHYDRRIRGYVRSRQKQIKLLEEQKQAIIHRYVTGQIDARTGRRYPRYKPSGVEWLGDVPEHWEVKPAKWVFQLLSGATPPNLPEHWDGDIVWVTPDDLGKLRQRDLFTSRRKITSEGYRSCGATLGPANSIVLSTRAPIGHTAVTRVAACVNQGCRLLVPRADQDVNYHYYQLVAARQELQSFGQGSTFAELSRERLAAIRFAAPPLPEQDAIVRFLDEATASVLDMVTKIRYEIALLREYRTRLIADVVTGKLDVREAAASRPDEPEDGELEAELVEETELEYEAQLVEEDADADD